MRPVETGWTLNDIWNLLLGFVIVFVTLFSLRISPSAENSTLPLDRTLKVEVTSKCEGSIDKIDGKSPSTDTLEVADDVSISGWLAISTSAGTVPERKFFALRNEAGEWLFLDANSSERLDVSDYFGNAALSRSGIDSRVNLSGLNGTYWLSLAYSNGTSRMVCDKFLIPIQVETHANFNIPAKPMKLLQEAPVADRCEGNIEAVNGEQPTSAIIRADKQLRASGWLAIDSSTGEVPDIALLVFRSSRGETLVSETNRVDRPDVGAYFKNNLLSQSGYEMVADISDLDGVYTIGLAYRREDIVVICAQFALPVFVGSKSTP